MRLTIQSTEHMPALKVSVETCSNVALNDGEITVTLTDHAIAALREQIKAGQHRRAYGGTFHGRIGGRVPPNSTAMLDFADVEKRVVVEALTLKQKSINGVPSVQYVTRNLPRGFETVLGYLAKRAPRLLELMEPKADSTLRDGFWLKRQSERRGYHVPKVRAPKFLRDQGIQTVNAYRLELLAERFGV